MSCEHRRFHFVELKGNSFERTIHPSNVTVVALMLLKMWRTQNQPPVPTRSVKTKQSPVTEVEVNIGGYLPSREAAR